MGNIDELSELTNEAKETYQRLLDVEGGGDSSKKIGSSIVCFTASKSVGTINAGGSVYYMSPLGATPFGTWIGDFDKLVVGQSYIGILNVSLTHNTNSSEQNAVLGGGYLATSNGSNNYVQTNIITAVTAQSGANLPYDVYAPTWIKNISDSDLSGLVITASLICIPI